MTERIMVPYRLPDGSIVQVDDSAAKGARCVSYTMHGGAIVRAYRVIAPLDLLRRIEGTEFECEGGSLSMNLDWQDLKRWIEDQQPTRMARPGEVDAYFQAEHAKSLAGEAK